MSQQLENVNFGFLRRQFSTCCFNWEIESDTFEKIFLMLFPFTFKIEKYSNGFPQAPSNFPINSNSEHCAWILPEPPKKLEKHCLS